MSDPAVVAMGDEVLKDSEGHEEQPEQVAAEAASHVNETETPDDGDHAAVASPKSSRPVTHIDTSPLLEPDLSSHPADELHRPDSPTTSLITSLRSQLTALSEQSHQLNTKLVASISRHADLEDQHYNLQAERDELRGKNVELTNVKETWENSMKTGLYVEQSQIRDEMQRLAAGLVEEERRRGSAEQRRQDVENEVDELATSLFEQANTMVAQERMGRLEAESRLKSTEENLAAAEAAVRDMQLHLQSLSDAVVPTNQAQAAVTAPRRFLSSHIPYVEFAQFVQHLRSSRPLREASKATFPPPPVTNLLTQPFLARTVAEDHDPTLRFDVAPDLSWLSRRGVTSAIISGELVIEPVSASTILATTTTAPGDIGCSLCGKSVFPNLVPQSPAISHFGPPPLHPTQRNSASRFSLKPFFNTTTTSPGPSGATQAPASPTQSPLSSPNPTSSTSTSLPSVYIFRIAKSTSTPAMDKEKDSSKLYPLCRSGWCLERLRATCALWHFVRTGLIHVIWTGDDGYILQSEASQTQVVEEKERAEMDSGEEKPPLPPRKRSGWGLGWGSKSGNTTPPIGGERKNSEAGSIGAEKLSDEPISTDGLAAPLELVPTTSEIEGEKREIPIIQAIDSSPITTTGTPSESRTPKPTEQDNVNELLQPEQEQELHRTQSAVSVISTNRSEQFTTPVSEHADLLDAEGSKLPEVERVSGEGDEKVKEEEQKSEQKEKEKEKEVMSPPPVPRRAAARQRMGASVDISREGSSIDLARSRNELEIKNLDEEKMVTQEETSSAEQALAPPPLPARQAPPQTPKNRYSRIDEKTYLPHGEDEDWEAKTWRMIMKLKEDMWKTRVGVVDGETD